MRPELGLYPVISWFDEFVELKQGLNRLLIPLQELIDPRIVHKLPPKLKPNGFWDVWIDVFSAYLVQCLLHTTHLPSGRVNLDRQSDHELDELVSVQFPLSRVLVLVVGDVGGDKGLVHLGNG